MTALQRAHAVAAARIAAQIVDPSELNVRAVLAESIGCRPTDRRIDEAIGVAHELGLVDVLVSPFGRIEIAADETALAEMDRPGAGTSVAA